MTAYEANRSTTQTLTGTAADQVTLTQRWGAVRITNLHPSNFLWVSPDSDVAVAEADGTIPVPPNSSRVIDVAHVTNARTMILGIVGNGNQYTVEGMFGSQAEVLSALSDEVAEGLGSAVTLAGAQTITGAKTFSVDPVLADGSSALSTIEGNTAYVKSESLWIPAAEMILVEGAPSLGTINGFPAWQFDAATSERVLTSLRLGPLGWATMHVDIYWANAGAGAGDVTWRLYHGPFTAGSTLTAGTSPGDLTDTAGAQNVLRPPFRLTTGLAVAADVQLIAIRRDASAPTDTLPNDAALIGVRLTKAS